MNFEFTCRLFGKRRGTISNTAARPRVESVEGRTLFSTFTVTTTADSGSGSLRAAIQSANANAGADTIAFKISAADAIITPTSGLPQLTGQVNIDATTQPGYSNKPVVRIDGSKSGGYGLVIRGGGSTVKGLDITGFSSGILILDGGNNTVKGCYIGIDRGGVAKRNYDKGIIVQSPNNTIGGTSAADRNVISGNTNGGIQLYTSAAKYNKIVGNFIGTNTAGSGAIGNGSGIIVNSGSNNTIGGTDAGARNIISGNNADGVVINTSGAQYNSVLGNYIGTDTTGSYAVANGNYGVEISESFNTVGGTSAAARNVISGNKYSGVVLWLSSGSNNTVQGNYVGTNAAGNGKIGNLWNGIETADGSSYNTIGGTAPGAGNVSSNNGVNGIEFYLGQGNTAQGNTVGFSAGRTIAMGNGRDGIQFAYCNTSVARYNYIGNNVGSGIANLGGSNSQSNNTVVNDTLYNV